jgi:hypothetical protein
MEHLHVGTCDRENHLWEIIDSSMKQWLKTLVRFQLVALDHTIGLWVLSSLLTPFAEAVVNGMLSHTVL